MKNLPKLIDWTKLASLKPEMRKQASSENPVIHSRENKSVTDRNGQEFYPKDGFSGPHLNMEGMVYYVKDGKKWCPYQKAFMEEKTSSFQDIIKIAQASNRYIDQIVQNPSMLSDFCSQYEYDGEPLACIRAAANSSNPALRKFAKLAAIDAKERLLKKMGSDVKIAQKIIGKDDAADTVKSKMLNFVISSVDKSEDKTPIDILAIMINEAEASGDQMLVDVIEDMGNKMKGPLVEKPLEGDDQKKMFSEAVSSKMTADYLNRRAVLKSKPEFVGEQIPGEFAKTKEEQEFGAPSGFVSISPGAAGTIKKSSSEDDMLKEAKKGKKSKKSVPTNKVLWQKCLAWAKSKYDVCPSAYCNGAAAKRYKKLGGRWKTKKDKK